MSQALPRLKKQQKPLVVFLRLYDLNKARMIKVCKATGLDHNAIGLAGTLAEITRHEQHASAVPPKVAKAIASYRKVTGRDDVDLILADAMRAHIQRASQCPARDSAAA